MIVLRDYYCRQLVAIAAELQSPVSQRYEKHITIRRRGYRRRESIRRSVSAETSIPRIEYGIDGGHQRQYDRGYPPPWIEAACAAAEIAKMTRPDKEKYYAR